MEKEPALIRTKVHQGITAGVLCYLIWGILPLYWKLFDGLSPIEVICQRVIWCFAFTALVCAIAKLDFLALLKDQRARRFLIPASLIITANWSIYIYAVFIDRVVEAALGYYINPLVSILLGLVCFKERLSPMQWIAVGLCCIGIGYFTFDYGHFPWISISLALSFGFYGAIKKQGGYPAIETIAVESSVMLIPAIVVAVILAFTIGSHGFLGDVTTPEGWAMTGLLVLAGILTAGPLILFAKAANSIPLTVLGFLQFISPTLSLLVGVFALGEPFTFAHGVCFGCIWTGLALVTIDSIRAARRTKPGELTPIEAEEAAETHEHLVDSQA